MYLSILEFEKTGVSIGGENIHHQAVFMITNTAAYTIVAIAYLTFAIGTWFLFTL